MSALGFLLAGLLLGAAHLSPQLGILAWEGIATLVLALKWARSPSARAGGILLAGQVRFSVSLSWLFWTGTDYLHQSAVPSAALVVGVAALCAVAGHGPMALVSATFAEGRTRGTRPANVPDWMWLGQAWTLGEFVRGEIGGGFLYGDWLDAHVDEPAVLQAVTILGAHVTRTLLIGTAALAAATVNASIQLVGRRSTDGLERAKHLFACACPGLGLVLVLSAFPPPAAPIPEAAPDVAAVRVEAGEALPTALPRPFTLVVLPEAVLRQRLRMVEGAVRSGPRVDGLPLDGATPFLVPAEIRTPEGAMNAAVAVTPEGTAFTSVGKRNLVPGGERRLAWLPFLFGDEAFVPGRLAPQMVVGGLHVIPLICMEVVSSDRAAEGRAGEGKLLAVMASDRPFGRSAIAREQSLAALRMRAAELQVFAVRSAVDGPAAIVAPNGVVIARVDRGTVVLPARP